MSVVTPRPKIASDRVAARIESDEFERMSAEEVLAWAIENFHPRLALSASFGAPEGMVLLDMMHAIEPASRVFVLDTGRLPQATYDLMDRVRERYGKTVEVVFPQADAVEKMVREYGLNLFYEAVEKRQLCCRIRKVEPLRRYLVDLDAWVSGLRRDQNVTRSDVQRVEVDAAHGDIVKVNPLVDWSSDRVWTYVRERGIPVNRLHAAGYPSVGCDPCSRAVKPGDDPRSGRWWWEHSETRECGIHTEEEGSGSGI